MPNQEKTDNLSKLALGAKLDRALGRRMGGQDAVMRPRGQTLSGEGEKGERLGEVNEKEGVAA